MRLDRLAALLVALVVVVVGTAYVLQRPTVWGSDAQVVLIPGRVAAGDASPLDSFTTGGTLGTTVELLSSPDLAQQVPQRGVTFTARAVTDSRVIAMHASGPRDLVRPALAALLQRAGPAQQRLADRWRISALTQPTPPVPGGPSTAVLLIATLLLALLAGVAVATGARRAVPELAGHHVRLLPRFHRRRPRGHGRSHAPWNRGHEVVDAAATATIDSGPVGRRRTSRLADGPEHER